LQLFSVYLDSKEVTYAGKEPDLVGLERASMETLAFKTEIPLNVLMYGADVNRATLEKITNFFVKRRANGPQGVYKAIIEEIANEYLMMRGYNKGKLQVKFNPFLDEDLTMVYAREADFANKVPGVVTNTELRRAIGMPDTPAVGPAEEYAKKQMQEQASLNAPQGVQNPQSPDAHAGAPSNELVKPKVPLHPAIASQKAKATILEEALNGRIKEEYGSEISLLETALINGNKIRPLEVQR
jgi:hypothetical protein